VRHVHGGEGRMCTITSSHDYICIKIYKNWCKTHEKKLNGRKHKKIMGQKKIAPTGVEPRTCELKLPCLTIALAKYVQ
jgi:hypothetical protein